jgi:hypothetical protein
MITSIASIALQSAIMSRLTGDEFLTTRITGVYDSLPAHIPFPYVVIGESTEMPWNGLTKIGRECTVTIHIFSRYAGMSEVKTLSARVVGLLERQSLAAMDVVAVSSVLDLCQFLTDPDGITRHAVIRMRFLAQ